MLGRQANPLAAGFGKNKARCLGKMRNSMGRILGMLSYERFGG